MNRRVDTRPRMLAVLGAFLAAVTAFAAISLLGRNFAAFTEDVQSALVGFGLLLVASCGWVSVSSLRLALRWTPVVGLFLSLESHWTLPIVHDLHEMPPLLAANPVIFALVAFVGGSAAVLFRRLKEKANHGDDG